MEIQIVRLELYPTHESTGWAVGLTVTTKTEKRFYRDVIVSFDEAANDDDAVKVALSKLKDDISQQVEELDKKPNLLGRSFKGVDFDGIEKQL